jgi:hypothetical protein
VRRWHSTRSPLRWAGTALVPVATSRYPATAALTAAAGISLLVLVLVVAVVTLGAAFSRSPARRRACLNALEMLLRLATWTRKR